MATAPPGAAGAADATTCGLPADEIARYGRQLIVPAYGPAHQLALRRLAVLVVGAGGLGCPVALYLAGAGVGALGIVDDDVVAVGNLHRQVAHAEAGVGQPKAASLAAAARALNGRVRATAHAARLTAANALALVAAHDCVVDCTDNPASRYLLNDACVLAGRPLVSAAALGCDGQLGVFAHAGGPCYRCLHPAPPGAVQSCADAGVLGPVTGAIGCLAALEVMKLAGALRGGGGGGGSDGGGSGSGGSDGGGSSGGTGDAAATARGFGESLAGRLLVLDGADARCRVVRLRPRAADCLVCGLEPTIRCLDGSAAWAAAHGLQPREVSFQRSEPAPMAGSRGGDDACGAAPCAAATADEAVPTVSVQQLAAARAAAAAEAAAATDPAAAGVDVPPPAPLLVLLDCRAPVQFAICSLRGSVNVPLAALQSPARADAALAAHGLVGSGRDDGRGDVDDDAAPVFVLCRRGVDSVAATRLLRQRGVRAFHVAGGLQAWSAHVDPAFPVY